MLTGCPSMRRLATFLGVFALVLVLAFVGRLHRTAYAAQSGNWSTGTCSSDGNNNHSSWWGHQEKVCELRTTTIKLGSPRLGVKSENGGIEVSGEDRGDVQIEARVEAWAGSEADARNILKQVTIDTSGDRIRDDGPHFHMNSGYGVSYTIRVPRRLAVDLKTDNGGIDIAHLDGEIRFDTTNGGVGLNDLAGDVRGSTTNGGLDITLSGKSWRGQGLNAETTNGGVSLKIPEHYSAHLETGTVNGGISLNFPITIQGDIKNRLSTNLGSGGPTIHAETTNGGVEIGRASGVE
jgi:DUF4097 and DUF4098 domain-containing protein YvlB